MKSAEKVRKIINEGREYGGLLDFLQKQEDRIRECIGDIASHPEEAEYENDIEMVMENTKRCAQLCFEKARRIERRYGIEPVSKDRFKSFQRQYERLETIYKKELKKDGEIER